MSPDPAGLVLLAAAFGLLCQAVRLGRRWRVGRAAPVDWLTGLLRLPHTYLRIVHEVVARDAYAARMHALAAGGLVGAVVLSFARHVLGLGGAAVAVGIVIAVGIAIVGVGMAAARRRPPRPPRLSGGRFDILPVALAGLLAFLLLALVPGWWAVDGMLGVLSAGTLLLWTVNGPMRHAAAGLVHLAAHSRPERLHGRPAVALRPLDLASLAAAGPDLPQLGTARAGDFAWTRLAQFDACVQCGRCQEVCPARAAGQPLNPKQFIQDLVAATDAASAAPAGALLVREPDAPGAIDADTLWACTTCRACVEACPMLIEHVDAIVDLRRYQTLERAALPAAAAAALGTLRATDTVVGRTLGARLDWTADLALPLLRECRQTEVLLWLGEGAFDRRHQRSLRALVLLLRRAGVEFAVLGEEELDCGDLARRLGDEVTFQDLARRNIATLSRYEFKTILTADPHALHTLRHEYPAFGGRYHVMHHAAFLEALFAAGRLSPAAGLRGGTVTYHDPCYLGRYNGETEAPRRLLHRLGLDMVEMERSGMRSFCCGGGGGAALSDVPGRRRIPDMRMEQARATGAPAVAVACPGCMQMLEGVTEPRPVVTDLAELALHAVDPAAA